MNALDYAILFGSILAIALYGVLRTRGRRNLHDYLRGQKKQSWFVIGLSVMATQASAITFLSTPGQAYAEGLSFIQNYFAVPLALIIIAAFFLPIYRKLNVYTAYEYLGKRFDKKTRLLSAILFLLQRGLGAGITIYAPAIVLSTVFNWSLPLTIIGSGLVVIVYTVVGGSDAVTHTQKYQLAIIFAGMVAAFVILVAKIPCSFTDALTLAGHFGKTKAVSFSIDPKERYTFWTGMCGGIFLMLSYFGTDQSQVQRYISGDNLRESRLGLMFNALFKIPMQFFILLLGVMLFVFYQFHPAPIFFNSVEFQKHGGELVHAIPMRGANDTEDRWTLSQLARSYREVGADASAAANQWSKARQNGDKEKESESLEKIDENYVASISLRHSAIEALHSTDNRLSANDNDYVFITFILENLPHGLIGILVASFFAAALSSKAAELNALASCTTIDFYRYLIHPPPVGPADPASSPPIEDRNSKIENAADRHYVRASKTFTIGWGLFAIAVALLAHMSENLIQASNILGSVFSGVMLGLFLIAFFLKHIRGTATFCGAIVAQLLIFALWLATYFHHLNIAYLWLNLIGCLACIIFAQLLQLFFPAPRQGFPVVPAT